MKRKEDIEQQISEIRKELQSTPEDPQLLHDLGIGLFLIGNYRESAEVLRRAVQLRPDNVSYRFNLGNAYAEMEDYGLAKSAYMDALDRDPSHIPSLTHLADLYEQTGEPEKAGELFGYVTRLAPGNALGFFNLGNFLLRQNLHIEAVKEYEKAIQIDPEFTDAYYTIAWVLKEAGAAEPAITYAKEGLKLNPESEELKKLLVEVQNGAGN
ncbi:MAG: tetratricopeptide repeat protein [Bacteroidetes bacterium]|nr:tetratricopeptide repeat protein [Bacteroidota bacterium]